MTSAGRATPDGEVKFVYRRLGSTDLLQRINAGPCLRGAVALPRVGLHHAANVGTAQ